MSPLRDNLDTARTAYRGTMYRGDLALDVLGADAGRSGASRGLVTALAVAAALAMGINVYLIASRAAAPEVAMKTQTTITPTIIEPTIVEPTNVAPTNVEPLTPTIVATNVKSATAPTATVAVAQVEEAFTLVPAIASAGEGASVVPNLGSLSGAVSMGPLSFMLPSADEYAEQLASEEDEKAATATEKRS